MEADPAQTLMDYLTPTLRESNTIKLPNLPKEVTFDLKHGFLQMLENNPFNGVAHENPM